LAWGIGGHQSRRAAEHLLMNAHAWQQQIAIVGAVLVDFVVDDDLCLGFLNFEEWLRKAVAEYWAGRRLGA
jgi:hypothetical protein